ncbi:hypothetical protein GMLC_34320 [Geomonas limicola]|uniref:histidine kinase n=1 Tax=Geomonas limicola TaxID=2740186 RepID=A0A6V8NE56_9BACT|nr:ATP-binding protein [Geomonas limicola]GFO69853.1 hypothetical protein GMLC_34320 [Geomonas limicola]
MNQTPRNASTCTTTLIALVRDSLNQVRAVLDSGVQNETTRYQILQLELLEQLLLDQEARLNAINRVLDEFNYTVAHELCAPLRRISGFTREIKQRWSSVLETEGTVRLDQILESAQKMNELIDALLQISRLSHVELQAVNLDLSTLAEEVAEEFRQGTPQRQVTFSIQPALTATGDPSLLKIAIRKLFGNAWKYTAGRSPAVIEFAACPDGNGFMVRDNGVGFDPADAAKLFHPFQHLHDQDRLAGHGIGLTCVRRIIERHCGKIWAWGVPGKGAIFYFTLQQSG